MSPRSLTAAFVLLSLCLGCQTERQKPPPEEPVEPSPNASILPAPLASDVEARGEIPDAGSVLRDAGADAGSVVPIASRADRELEPNPELARDPNGLVLRARWRWLDLAPAPGVPELNRELVDRVREELAFLFELELSAAGRMQLTLAADSFVLPRGTELRSRLDRFGHAVVWPDQSRYAVLPAGGLRALLNERRSDVMPLTRPKPVTLNGGEVLGAATERKQLTTPHGRLDLDQARVSASGYGGLLLCRFLVELVAADPESSLCAVELVPVRAEYTWAGGGRALFEVTKFTRSAELDPEELAVPPPRTPFVRGELPAHGAPLLVPGPDLSRFRLRPATRPEKPGERRDSAAVKDGLVVVNRGELSLYLVIDGVPVLRAAPRSEDLTLPLIAGTYAAAGRDFLGTLNIAQSVLGVPARIVLSDAATSAR